jgi:excisionase family DNA binding protein
LVPSIEPVTSASSAIFPRLSAERAVPAFGLAAAGEWGTSASGINATRGEFRLHRASRAFVFLLWCPVCGGARRCTSAHVGAAHVGAALVGSCCRLLRRAGAAARRAMHRQDAASAVQPILMKSEILENREPPKTELFTASQVARFCHVDLKTIHNWVEKGEIRHFRTPGRHLRFRRLDIVDFLHKYGYPVPEALRGAKPKVAMLDADPAVLTSVRRALGRRFEITAFSDPFEALVGMGISRPDALVLDLTLPGLDALQLLQRLKAIEATAPIRLIVYSAREQERRAALEAGANDFVPKGEVALLRESIERWTGLDRG